MNNHSLAIAGFMDHGMDLPRRLNVGAAKQTDRGILKLHQSSLDHSLGSVAGGVGNDENSEHGINSFRWN
jgi:hypothetical protein